jgi:hypothetical protein
MRAQWEMSRDQFFTLVSYLNRTSATYDIGTPVLSDEDNKNKEGSFVWDHARVTNEALKLLGYEKEILQYTGRIYMPWELKEKDRTSFGDHLMADEVCLQIRTPNGGHFRGANFDPWKPGTKMIDLKSIRYYRWIKAN